jgi:GMP synthase-like glutamine amidotransferase
MKSILIFEHIASSGPGLFQTFLLERSIPFQILRPNQGEAIPGRREISHYSGLCFLGGIESVTEPTDAMKKELSLIQTAADLQVPVIGHCLGGQLISKALGGEVIKHDAVEFGWSKLSQEDNRVSHEWVADCDSPQYAMQWHSDTFTIPEGTTRILTGEHCQNQAFVRGNILAMQFHIEIDYQTIKYWALDLVEKHPATSDSAQSGEEIIEMIDANFTMSKNLAGQLYSKWLGNFISNN